MIGKSDIRFYDSDWDSSSAQHTDTINSKADPFKDTYYYCYGQNHTHNLRRIGSIKTEDTMTTLTR